MNDYWDNSPEQEEFEDDGREGTFIYVNGSQIDVRPGTNFISAVKDAALNAGLSKFRTILNGENITPSDAPEFFEEGDRVELRRYDVAG